jgi:ribosomal subunit interface protein
MKYILSTHNVKLTQEIEDHIIDRIGKLERLDQRAVEARVTLVHDTTKAPDKQFCCSVRIGVRGPDLFAEEYDSKLDSAIDLAMKKVELQTRKRHDKIKNRKHSPAALIQRRRKEQALT